jgi:hypothetical protein
MLRFAPEFRLHSAGSDDDDTRNFLANSECIGRRHGCHFNKMYPTLLFNIMTFPRKRHIAASWKCPPHTGKAIRSSAGHLTFAQAAPADFPN